jgi:hypothetical protein
LRQKWYRVRSRPYFVHAHRITAFPMPSREADLGLGE